MRTLAAISALLACTATIAGCTPARIVATDGRQVTFAWNAQETRIARVYELAITYCNRWSAPPALVSDQADGDEHTTTFVCRARPGLPLNQLL